MSTTCEHSMKARKEGLCAKCAEIKPYAVFKTCKNECFACNECGWFWGSGASDGKAGKPMYREDKDRGKNPD